MTAAWTAECEDSFMIYDTIEFRLGECTDEQRLES